MFSGYPGTWYLLAASTAGDAGSPMADKTDRLMRAVDVLQLGLQHCRAHVVLLFGLLLAVMKLGPGKHLRHIVHTWNASVCFYRLHFASLL